MHNLYTPVLVIHVLAAVLGLGLITSVGIVATTARRTQHVAHASIWLFPLLRYATFSLVTMLATGVLLDFAASGAFSAAWWFRGSVLLLVATGILNGVTRRTIRAVPAHGEGEAPMMETKPF